MQQINFVRRAWICIWCGRRLKGLSDKFFHGWYQCTQSSWRTVLYDSPDQRWWLVPEMLIKWDAVIGTSETEHTCHSRLTALTQTNDAVVPYGNWGQQLILYKQSRPLLLIMLLQWKFLSQQYICNTVTLSWTMFSCSSQWHYHWAWCPLAHEYMSTWGHQIWIHCLWIKICVKINTCKKLSNQQKLKKFIA